MRAWAVIALAALGGCATEVTCGPGTLAVGGSCLADLSPLAAYCGDGTELDPVIAECVPAEPLRQCDPCATTVEVDGALACDCSSCEGYCDVPIACPPPDDGKVSVCGHVRDLASWASPSQPEATGGLCDPTAPTDAGPCSLELAGFDPLALAADPDDTPPLTADEVSVDDCGRYRLINLTRPFNGHVAVRVRGPGFAATITTRAVDPGEGVQMDAAVLATETATAWSAVVGVPDIVAQGIGVARYRYLGEPVAGVSLLCGADPCDDAYYFADTEPNPVGLLAADLAATGTNGAAARVASPLSNSATNAPPGCEWPGALAPRVPGLASYAEVTPVIAGDATQPCP